MKNLPVYLENPFKMDLSQFEMNVWKDNQTATRVYDIKTGEEFEIIRKEGDKTFISDKQPFIKINVVGISKIVIGMSNSALYLFFYIMETIKPNSDLYHLDQERFLEQYGYKQSSKMVFYRAITELLDRGIVAKAAGFSRSYWINPNIFFNGGRTNLLKKYKNAEIAVKVKHRKKI